MYPVQDTSHTDMGQVKSMDRFGSTEKPNNGLEFINSGIHKLDSFSINMAIMINIRRSDEKCFQVNEERSWSIQYNWSKILLRAN